MANRWNVMVYQAGDNNLSEEMVWALQGLRGFSSKTGLNVFAQLDPLGAYPRNYDFTQHKKGTLGQIGTEISVTSLLKQKKAFAPIQQKLMITAGLSRLKTLLKSKSKNKELCNYLRSFHRLFLKGTKPLAAKLAKKDPTIKQDLGGDQVSDIWSSKKNLEDLYMLFKTCETDLENSASQEMIEKFVKKNINKGTPNYRMLVLSGHASGAVGEFLKDVRSSTSINMIKFADIVKKFGGRIDILGMDSCVMSTAEVCHQIGSTNKVGILVASEGFIVNTGWPYEKILTALAGMKKRPPVDVARKIVQEHISFYEDYALAGISVDCAAIQLDEFEISFVTPFKEFSQVLYDKISTGSDKSKWTYRNLIVLAHWEAQCYNDDQYVDVYDFCRRLKTYYVKEFYPGSFKDMDKSTEKKDDVINAINDVTDSFKKVVLGSCYAGPAFQYSQGISVYFPWGLVDYVDAYDELAFPQRTGWGDFLRTLLRDTQREVRPGVAPKQVAVPMNQPMLLIRKSPPWTKGAFCDRKGSTKNHPNEFYRHACYRKNLP
jgi:hypothetical protein